MQIYAINTNKPASSQNLKTICHSKVTFSFLFFPIFAFIFYQQASGSSTRMGERVSQRKSRNPTKTTDNEDA